MESPPSKRIGVLALSFLYPNQSDPDYGVFVRNRLRALHRLCDVTVIAPIQWYPVVSFFMELNAKSKVPFHTATDGFSVYHPRFATIPRFLKFVEAITFWFAVHRTLHLIPRERALELDVVEVHWTYPDVVAGYFVARARHKKFLVTIRGHEAFYAKEWSVRRLLVAFFLRRADFVIALSEDLQREVVRLGVDWRKTAVVLNGVDSDTFSPLDTMESRKQLGLSLSRRVIVSVGRVTEGKGHQHLVRMMAMLEKDLNADLYIIGGTNAEDDFTSVLRKLISDYGLQSVHLVEKVDHARLPAWYSAADLFCLASKSEGCPNAVLEALACGTPVVATNVGSVSTFVKNGKNGLVVNPAELENFAEYVGSALRTSWDRHAIAQDMRTMDWMSCASNLQAIYSRVLNQTPIQVADGSL